VAGALQQQDQRRLAAPLAAGREPGALGLLHSPRRAGLDEGPVQPAYPVPSWNAASGHLATSLRRT
jgi:hypothetical protein